jgi:hypothetical protein
LWCDNNHLTVLDISKNTSLIWMDCNNNQLTALDASQNTSLNELSVKGNKLETQALNILFRSLHNNSVNKMIFIINNPGSNDCDESIATAKGWYVSHV